MRAALYSQFCKLFEMLLYFWEERQSRKCQISRIIVLRMEYLIDRERLPSLLR